MENSSQYVDKLPPLDRKLIAWGMRKKADDKRDGERGIFLEGPKLIKEALAINHPLTMVWHTHEFASAEPGLIYQIKDLDPQNIKEIPARLMRSISDMKSSPGIIAVAPQPGFIFREAGDPFSLIVVLTRVQDPGNLGGVIRSADFFGVDEIWLGPGSVDAYSPKVLRGTMGSSFRIAVIPYNNLSERLNRFRAKGADVWAAVAHDESAEVQITASKSRIIMIGSESQGLSDYELDLADHRVFIPGANRSESLNLSVAAGILIYSATSGRYKRDQQ